MTAFRFDNTLEGLLTAVFEAYARHTFPDILVPEGAVLPLFCEELLTVVTDEAKASRVWQGLGRKLSSTAMRCVAGCWLAEEVDTPIVLFRFIRKVIDTSRSIETDFGDADVLAFTRMWQRVERERTRLLQFIRFQKAADGVYFAAVEPEKNALPLIVSHFRDRFADQPWVIYDVGRTYGFYYDRKEVRRITFDESDGLPRHLVDGKLDSALMAEDERLFQSLWKTYFKAICIRERANPRKQRADMPERYWKFLTEKQGD